MTTALTFQVGRRPGVVRRQFTARKPTFGLNGSQRAALSELVHGRSVDDAATSYGRRAGVDFVWAAILALVFVLAGRTLYEGLRFVQSADTAHAHKASEPQVDLTITRLPPSTEALRADAPVHSSTVARRTM